MLTLNLQSVQATLFFVLWIVTLIGHEAKGREINPTGPKNLKQPDVDSSPEICRTFKTNGSDLPSKLESPFEIVVNRVAPSIYEVIIQGKKGQLFTDFVLGVTAPYPGEFRLSKGGHYESYGCDMTDPYKQTLLRALKSNRLAPKRQIVAHFHPMKASGKVILRGSVYLNETTFWNLENSSLHFS